MNVMQKCYVVHMESIHSWIREQGSSSMWETRDLYQRSHPHCLYCSSESLLFQLYMKDSQIPSMLHFHCPSEHYCSSNRWKLLGFKTPELRGRFHAWEGPSRGGWEFYVAQGSTISQPPMVVILKIEIKKHPRAYCSQEYKGQLPASTHIIISTIDIFSKVTFLHKAANEIHNQNYTYLKYIHLKIARYSSNPERWY